MIWRKWPSEKFVYICSVERHCYKILTASEEIYLQNATNCKRWIIKAKISVRSFNIHQSQLFFNSDSTAVSHQSFKIDAEILSENLCKFICNHSNDFFAKKEVDCTCHCYLMANYSEKHGFFREQEIHLNSPQIPATDLLKNRLLIILLFVRVHWCENFWARFFWCLVMTFWKSRSLIGCEMILWTRFVGLFST